MDLRPVARADNYQGLVGEFFQRNVKHNDYQGDAPAYTRIVAGQLPPGIHLRYDGLIVGTPTKAGTYYIKYKLRDKDGDASYSIVTIVIKEPNLLPEAVDDEFHGDIGIAFSENVIDNDTPGDGPATAEQIDGELPPGLSISADGSLSGVPTASGVFVADYKITDSNGDTSNASITITIKETISYCPQPALSDELHGGSDSHAIWIPEISKNLQFLSQPNTSRVLPNGDLTIFGTVADGDIQFDVTLNYSGYTDYSDSPKLELKNSAYKENGGPIDPSTWEFYSHFSATFIGTNGIWDGVKLTAELRGPLAQLGLGANGKNGNHGLANWFNATIKSATGTLPDGFSIDQTLAGDVNIDLPDECPRKIVKTQCSVTAVPDEFGQSSGNGHSVVIVDTPSRRLSFDPAGQVDIYDNGDISISGTVVDNNDGSKLEVTLNYTQATDVNANPKLELIPAAYADQGGPVDPSTWNYFADFSGVLAGPTGDPTYDGVVFNATLRDSIPQIGEGANGKNIGFGLSNWFDLIVVDAPASSTFAVGDTFTGDVNIGIKDNCDVIVDNPVDAINDSYTLNMGQLLEANILDNDVLGDPSITLTFDPESVPEGFALSIDEDTGAISGSSFEPGTYVFSYTITDADGDTDTATVTIVILNNTPDG